MGSRASAVTMLIDEDGTIAVSSLGWVDRGALWTFRAASGAPEIITLDGSYLGLHEGIRGSFAVQHSYDRAPRAVSRLRITVRGFERPDVARATVTIEDGRAAFEGDAAAWRDVPRWYAAYHPCAVSPDWVLVRIDAQAIRADVRGVPWFDERYDKAYQGIVGVVAVPDRAVVLVSVQRSSSVVIHDPESGRRVGAVELGDRAGNPRVRFLRRRRIALASDYDTLVRLDAGDLKVSATLRLQPAAGAVSQFIGEFAVDREERFCLVARPYSADVAVVDVERFKVVGSISTGRQPLDVGLMRDGSIVARDWKSGDLIRASLDLH